MIRPQTISPISMILIPILDWTLNCLSSKLTTRIPSTLLCITSLFMTINLLGQNEKIYDPLAVYLEAPLEKFDELAIFKPVKNSELPKNLSYEIINYTNNDVKVYFKDYQGNEKLVTGLTIYANFISSFEISVFVAPVFSQNHFYLK